MDLRIITIRILIQAARYLVRPKKKSQPTVPVAGILEVIKLSWLGERLCRFRTVDSEETALLSSETSVTVYQSTPQLLAYFPVPLYWLRHRLSLTL